MTQELISCSDRELLLTIVNSATIDRADTYQTVELIMLVLVPNAIGLKLHW